MTEHTPLEVLRRYPSHARTLHCLLASRARAVPGHAFIEFAGARLTYAETLVRVSDAMAWLTARGVKPGDRIAVMSHNHPSTVVLLIALASLGAILVGVNPDFGEKEARYVLEHSGASGIVCSPAALPTLLAVAGTLPAQPWLVAHSANAAGLPVFLETRAAARGDAAEPVPQAVQPTTPAPEGGADDACLIIYTSGTTGFPKGVMHSQQTLVLAGEGFVRRMFLQPDERLLCILPMFHVNAICYSLMGTLAAGATLLLEEKFSASSFWRTVAERRATETNTIAAVMNILMRRPRDEFVPGHGLAKIYGAPLSLEMYRVFEGEFGVPHLIEGYGMSEIPGACNNPFDRSDGERRKGSMGRPSRHPDPAVKFAEVQVLGDDGAPVPPGTEGELAVKTPLIMQGYYRDTAATAAAFRDGWFLTGDLVRMDADGYVWFVTRKKDIIRRRGENISGAEIDRIAGDHPEVVEAAAIGVAAELGEEEVLLAVVKKPGSPLTEQQLADWCRQRLAAFKVPRYVLFVDALPRTPTHRVAKFELRKDPTLKQRAVDIAAAAR